MVEILRTWVQGFKTMKAKDLKNRPTTARYTVLIFEIIILQVALRSKLEYTHPFFDRVGLHSTHV